MEETATQKGVGEFFFVVAGNDDDGALASLDGFPSFIDIELHAVEFLQEVVRKFNIGFVDFVDEQHRLGVGFKGLPQLALENVIPDVLDLVVAQLGIAQAGDGIVFVQPPRGFGGGLDVPRDEPAS